MQQWLGFFMNHWVLWSLFLVFLLAALSFELRGWLSGIQLLTSQEVVHKVNREQALLVDIRSKEEFDKGHIQNAISVPFTKQSSGFAALEKFKNKPIVLYCQMGQQAPTMGRLMKQQGFQDIYAMTGGVAAWRNGHLPLVS